MKSRATSAAKVALVLITLGWIGTGNIYASSASAPKKSRWAKFAIWVQGRISIPPGVTPPPDPEPQPAAGTGAAPQPIKPRD